MKVERVRTGITGFDELVEGGFLRNRIILLTGNPGSGKTIFAMQFLYNGAVKFGEPGIYVTLEEEVRDLQRDMGRFGWDLKAAEEQKKLLVLRSPIPFEVGEEGVKIDDLLERIHKVTLEINAKRIVIDSIVGLGLQYQTIYSLRRDLLRLSALLRDLDLTSLLITEWPIGSRRPTRFGVEEFVAQGVIVLHYISQNFKFFRCVEIRKMRGTKHNPDLNSLRITDEGMVVTPGVPIFGLKG